MANARKKLDVVGWGLIIWEIGYGSSLAFFNVVPVPMIGWFVLPILVLVTIYVSLRRFKGSREDDSYYAIVAVV